MCEYNGLNLTLAVREGILKQTKNIDKNGLINYPEKNYDNIDLSLPSFTLEGQVAAIADEVAQCTHDLEDGVRSKIISYNDVKSFPIIQTVIQTNEEKNNTLSSSPAYDIRNYVI